MRDPRAEAAGEEQSLPALTLTSPRCTGAPGTGGDSGVPKGLLRPFGSSGGAHESECCRMDPAGTSASLMNVATIPP